MLRPLAIWRCVCDSIVRAPIAAHETRSSMYCGVIGIEHLGARREPERRDVEQQPPREAQALLHVEAAVQVRIVDQALPAHRRARLLEVRAHDDRDAVAELGRAAPRDAPRTRGRRRRRGSSTGPTSARKRRSRPSRIASTVARPAATVACDSGVIGSSCLSCRGVTSERKLATLRSWIGGPVWLMTSVEVLHEQHLVVRLVVDQLVHHGARRQDAEAAGAQPLLLAHAGALAHLPRSGS